MKKMAHIMLCLLGVLMGMVHGAEETRVFLEPLATNVTSEFIPFRMCFTNLSDKTVSVLKPVAGRDLVIRVYGKNGDELARSGIPCEYASGYWKDVKEEHVVLGPYATCEAGRYELFAVARPSFRMTPDQTVRVEATYSMQGKEYKADVLIHIPPHDMKIKPGYISKEKARELAVAELRNRGFSTEKLLKGIEPEVMCINGIYRVSYSRSVPSSILRDPIIVSVCVDAANGQVLKLLIGQ